MKKDILILLLLVAGRAHAQKPAYVASNLTTGPFEQMEKEHNRRRV